MSGPVQEPLVQAKRTVDRCTDLLASLLDEDDRDRSPLPPPSGPTTAYTAPALQLDITSKLHLEIEGLRAKLKRNKARLHQARDAAQYDMLLKEQR